MSDRGRSPLDTGLLRTEVCDDGAVARCLLHGEVDISNVEELRAALGGLHVAGHPRVLVDLSDVSFLGVVGMRALLETHLAFDAEDRRLLVVGPSPSIRRMLVLAGLSAMLEVSASE